VPDIYATITEVDPAVVERIGEILELRAADEQQRAMREAYLSEIGWPDQARVLEVGCGQGPVARALASSPGIGEVVGVDPSPIFVGKARELAAELANLSFIDGDARALPLDDRSFDVVIFHTTLCHVPRPELALAEAARVLRPEGWLAVFDGDYATTTCASGDHDPLQACADAWVATSVHDRWLMRRVSKLATAAGFDGVSFRSHGCVETPSGGYMLTIVDRGADALLAAGRITAEASAALKDEALRRSSAGRFFGHIAYASLIARNRERSASG
jgi:ubiquinone/menaquinone biosynthesis C-methylase UbiE